MRGYVVSYGNMTDIIKQTAKQMGIPAWIPLTIAQKESSLNPRAVGDNGTSFGLFQLHRGGLAPSGMPAPQLEDPATNAGIAIQAMIPSYRRGSAMGLSGVSLLDYVANTSGWPGKAGPGHYPQYDAGLNQIYASGGGSLNAADTLSQGSGSGSSPAGAFFSMLDNHLQIDSYKTWHENNRVAGLNPFAYPFDQGKALLLRTVIVIVGLFVILIALKDMIQGQLGGTP